jgi:hypothetical protein
MSCSLGQRLSREKEKSKKQEMKRSSSTNATSAGRIRWVYVTTAILFALLTVTIMVISPSAAMATRGLRHGDVADLFYTTSGAGTGLVNGAEIFAITVSGDKVTTRDIGPTHGGDCGSLALSPQGTLYSMCGSLFADQQLATINQNTGRAHLFGVPVPGLAVMAMAFGPNGTLYAVGDCNPDPTTFECTPGSDPTYNSLYKVDVRTGMFSRIGSTGAPQLFMDLTFDRNGNMLGVTTTINPSAVPAILYRIDPTTGKATKVFNLVGSNYVMGLAFGREANLYATDNFPYSGLYRIDPNTGVETAIAAMSFGFSSGLELMDPASDLRFGAAHGSRDRRLWHLRHLQRRLGSVLRLFRFQSDRVFVRVRHDQPVRLDRQLFGRLGLRATQQPTKSGLGESRRRGAGRPHEAALTRCVSQAGA